MRRTEWIETTAADLRFGLRQIARNKVVSLVAIVTLALGIGANTAIFSVVNGVLLRALPFRDADRVVLVWNDYSRFTVRTDITSFPTYTDWRTRSRTLQDLAAFFSGEASLTGGIEPERVRRAWITPNFNSVLGVQPALGRGFHADESEAGKERVVVLAHGIWQRRFGSDPRVIGRKVQLNGSEFEIVGVMPPRFDFPSKAELWTPLSVSDNMRGARTAYWLYTVGRLKDGVSVETCQADMTKLAADLRRTYPEMEGEEVFVQPIRDHLVGEVRPALLVLLGAVGLVLLIACVNVTNLLLARAAVREREIAVRLALGAGRARLVRQLLTESLVIAVAGGLVGLVLAYAGVDALKAIAPRDLPRLEEVRVDGGVLFFSLVLALVTGLVFGLVPALQSSRVGTVGSLKEGARGMGGTTSGGRVRRALVVAEVALALVLLLGAGLLVRSFVRLRGVDSGFEPRGVLTARIALTGPQYQSGVQGLAFYDRLFERLRAMPQVESVAGSSGVLLPELPNSGGVTIEGHPRDPSDRTEVTRDVVTPGFFRTVGTRLVGGRDVTESDVDGAILVAIINESMARKYWRGEEAVGRRFKFGGPDSRAPWLTVVGVVADARRTGPDKDARPSAYLSYRQRPSPSMMLVLRAKSDPLQLAGPLREAVRMLDASQPVSQLMTLEALLSERLAQRRLTTLLAALFSGVALLLALIGIYGVISYWVAQSTTEFGVRLALGAGPRQIALLVLRRVTVLVVLGIAIGLAGGILVNRSFSRLLFGVGTMDPATYLAVPLVLFAVGLLAAAVPARRASSVAPMVALRME